jgi:hypothetical protein
MKSLSQLIQDGHTPKPGSSFMFLEDPLYPYPPVGYPKSETVVTVKDHKWNDNQIVAITWIEISGVQSGFMVTDQLFEVQ